MPYDMEWLVKDEVLFITVRSKLTDTEEQRNFFQEVVDLTMDAREPFHIITDMRQQTGRMSVGDATDMAFHYSLQGKIKWVISVGDIGYKNIYLSELIAQLFGVRLLPTEKIADAIEFLRQEDPDIDWDSADYSIIEEPEGV